MYVVNVKCGNYVKQITLCVINKAKKLTNFAFDLKKGKQLVKRGGKRGNELRGMSS